MKQNNLIKILIFTFTILILPVLSCENPRVAVIGTGYVGAVTSAGLSLYHNVIGADVDSRKIDMLSQGTMPIYEPGLEDLVKSNLKEGRLSFTTNVAQAIQQSNIIFVAVGTPQAEDGSADLSYVKSVAQIIRDNLNDYKIIVIKSTVPLGTGHWVKSLIEENPKNKGMFDMVSNPEFLREGTAILDFMHPDRIVIGAESKQAFEGMQALYRNFTDDGVPLVESNIVTAETIKYASNAFLAIKLSFINELSQLTDIAGADIKLVAQGMGLDKRINSHFTEPSPGWGGSCFPKDSQALEAIGKKYGVDLKLVTASIAANKLQKQLAFSKLLKIIGGSVKDKIIAVLGLSFKANTDDVRESSAIDILSALLAQGASVQAYDPVAALNMARIFPTVTYADSAYDAIKSADAIIILTEWPEFKQLDLKKVAELVKNKVIVDGRNLFDPKDLKDAGFTFANMGRSNI